MKKVIITIFLFAVVNVSAQNKDWTGVFSHYVERFSAAAGQPPTAEWSKLLVKLVDKKLVGVYSKGYNGTATERFQVKIKVKDDIAEVFYDKCLPQIEGSPEKCSDYFDKNDLLFRLEKSEKEGKIFYYTIWEKMFVNGKATRIDNQKLVFFAKKV